MAETILLIICISLLIIDIAANVAYCNVKAAHTKVMNEYVDAIEEKNKALWDERRILLNIKELLAKQIGLYEEALKER